MIVVNSLFREILVYIGIVFYMALLGCLYIFLDASPGYLSLMAAAIFVLIIIYAANKGWLKTTQQGDETTRKYF